MMAQVSYEEAYPGIHFLPRSRNWWARLKGVAAECEHLDGEVSWMATIVPDTLYLRGKAATRRRPARPEASLCRACFLRVLAQGLPAFDGRVVAFEPDPETFSQYFFVAATEFEAAGLVPEVAEAIRRRLGEDGARCQRCGASALWLWLGRKNVASLDESEKILTEPGEYLCTAHGVQKICAALGEIPEANLFYVNLPYGEAGAYIWI